MAGSCICATNVKDILSRLNKDFENRFRLGIMSLLMVHERVDFNTFKELLRTTDEEPISDGNLASHLNSLEKRGYLRVSKQFVGRKPRTSYGATPEGRAAFDAHLNALEALLSGRSAS